MRGAPAQHIFQPQPEAPNEAGSSEAKFSDLFFAVPIGAVPY